MTTEAHSPDLAAKIQKIADQLVFLEKKLDTLLERSAQGERKPFGGDRKPFGGGFRPREGQGRGPFVPRGGRRDGYPAKNYNGPQGPHGTRTARYEGSSGGYSAGRPQRPNRPSFQKKFQPHRNSSH